MRSSWKGEEGRAEGHEKLMEGQGRARRCVKREKLMEARGRAKEGRVEGRGSFSHLEQHEVREAVPVAHVARSRRLDQKLGAR